MATFTYTFGDIKNDVRYQIRDPRYARFDEAYVEKKIAEKYLQIIRSRDWNFNIKTADISVVGDDNTFTLPEDFDHTNPSKYALYKDSIAESNKMTYLINGKSPDSTVSGAPLYWWIENRVGYIYPKSNSSYTLKMTYNYVPAQLDATNPIPIIPTGYSSMISWGTSLEILPSNDPNLTKCQISYDNLYDDLVAYDQIRNENSRQSQILEGNNTLQEESNNW